MNFKYGKVNFGYKDSCSADPVLSKIIADWLINFRKVLTDKRDEDFIGCPSIILQEYFKEEYDKDPYNVSNELVEKGLSKWLEIIDEMIYGFSAEKPHYRGGYKEGPDHGKVSYEGGLRLTQWNMEPVDEDAYRAYEKASEEHLKRAQRGRELFGKYFDNLWW